MAVLQLTGHVDENGRLEIAERVDFPPGDVIVTLESVTAEELEAIDSAWDNLLTSPRSLAVLERMGAKALAELDAGLTDELDPDTL